MKTVIEGSHAVSYGAMLSRVQVISAYPITPQTHIVEKLAELCASGELQAKFIKVESEHSAMASCIGASAVGARAFTATSSQGLALMHELLHWASGARVPVVMANVNRTLAAPWNIWCDQTDSLSQRDTGWLQFYCESSQEVLDTVIQAFRISEAVSLPSMVVLDAFYLSHTFETVDLPDVERVDRFLPPYDPKYKLDPKDPRTIGSLTPPELLTEMRFQTQEAMEEAKSLILQVNEEYYRSFGRRYGLVEAYRCDDPELVVVTSGTVSSTCREVVDRYRGEGKAIGLLKIRTFRPFPSEEVRRALKGVPKVAVIDRNISYGVGGIFAAELKSAICSEEERPTVFSYITGLGGRDITVETLSRVIENTIEQDDPGRPILWPDLMK
ncbi:MAG: pyruvate ferredoxin oxidoreductase [Deltaproteobacteria bacterium RBG_13_53_10]|nr:MAG: pyruvate ferredoxin oxidoreductase [Deltaproteobacteria bacterium RBG_13_53_10]